MPLSFAKRMSYLKASEIREILKVTEQEDVISFAGGLPAPELFPIEEINEVSQIVLKESGAKALQYSTTEGYPPLREWIANRMNTRLGTSFDKDNILITHGSQQGLDLSGKVFLDEGDVVLCESPTYLAAISAFKAYGCRFVEIPTDQEGMMMEALGHAKARAQFAVSVATSFQFGFLAATSRAKVQMSVTSRTFFGSPSTTSPSASRVTEISSLTNLTVT